MLTLAFATMMIGQEWRSVGNRPGWESYGLVGDNGYLISFKFRKDNKEISVEEFYKNWEKEISKPTTNIDPYGFGVWINSIRASYNLPALTYDETLTYWAYQNNLRQTSFGMGHHIMGPAKRQNAAYSYDMYGVGNMWMSSPAHQSALLDPTIRWFGISMIGAYWTFNAN